MGVVVRKVPHVLDIKMKQCHLVRILTCKLFKECRAYLEIAVYAHLYYSEIITEIPVATATKTVERFNNKQLIINIISSS